MSKHTKARRPLDRMGLAVKLMGAGVPLDIAARRAGVSEDQLRRALGAGKKRLTEGEEAGMGRLVQLFHDARTGQSVVELCEPAPEPEGEAMDKRKMWRLEDLEGRVRVLAASENINERRRCGCTSRARMPRTRRPYAHLPRRSPLPARRQSGGSMTGG